MAHRAHLASGYRITLSLESLRIPHKLGIRSLSENYPIRGRVCKVHEASESPRVKQKKCNFKKARVFPPAMARARFVVFAALAAAATAIPDAAERLIGDERYVLITPRARRFPSARDDWRGSISGAQTTPWCSGAPLHPQCGAEQVRLRVVARLHRLPVANVGDVRRVRYGRARASCTGHN